MKKFLATVSASLILLLSAAVPVVTAFGTSNLVPCTGSSAGAANNPADSGVCQSVANQQAQSGNPNPVTGPGGILAKTSRILGIVIGVASIIVFLISGLRYVTAGGNTDQTAKAKKEITYAIVGLIIAFVAGGLSFFFTHILL